MSIVRDAGYSATTRVPTIEVQDQHIRADIYIPQMQVDGCRGLCIDASRVHDFHGSTDNPSQNGTLRYSDINLVLFPYKPTFSLSRYDDHPQSPAQSRHGFHAV